MSLQCQKKGFFMLDFNGKVKNPLLSEISGKQPEDTINVILLCKLPKVEEAKTPLSSEERRNRREKAEEAVGEISLRISELLKKNGINIQTDSGQAVMGCLIVRTSLKGLALITTLDEIIGTMVNQKVNHIGPVNPNKF